MTKNIRLQQRKRSLCDENGDNFPKSHVIPKGLYPKIQTGNPFVKLSVDGSVKKDNFRQNGIFDNKILCDACEKKTAKWDSGAIRIFNRILNSPVSIIGTSNYKEIFFTSGDEYKDFKLFFLSLLYRANFASDDFFEDVCLGIKHTKKLRIYFYPTTFALQLTI